MEYGLIGEKLSHSFSKPIHESFGFYEYEIKEIKKEDLSSFLKKKEFKGINVTIPYKESVIPFLDYIDEGAKKIGAVNTVVNKDGKLFGYNTDFLGLKLLVQRSGVSVKDKKVLILGSGGTSKTASAVFEALSAGEIIKVSRKGEVNYENLYALHSDADIIVNTTPVGMYPNPENVPVDIGSFEKLSGVFDVIYNPLRTRLCLEAEERGIKYSGGLFMLVAQAVFACEYFTEKNLNTKAISEEIFEKIKSEKENLVLIGMPGCGKTTIGKALSERTGKTFVDTDELIKADKGDISEIFSAYGEKYFRDAESEKVFEVSKKNSLIIATGGGAVLRKENVLSLKSNGRLIFLDRPLSDIVPTDDRPLSKNSEDLKKRFSERYPLYCSLSEKRIEVDGVVENSVEKILKN